MLLATIGGKILNTLYYRNFKGWCNLLFFNKKNVMFDKIAEGQNKNTVCTIYISLANHHAL